MRINRISVIQLKSNFIGSVYACRAQAVDTLINITIEL